MKKFTKVFVVFLALFLSIGMNASFISNEIGVVIINADEVEYTDEDGVAIIPITADFDEDEEQDYGIEPRVGAEVAPVEGDEICDHDNDEYECIVPIAGGTDLPVTAETNHVLWIITSLGLGMIAFVAVIFARRKKV